VGAVLGRSGRKRKEARALAQGRESLEAELLAEIGILRARLEVLGRAAQRRDPDLDERAARAWLAVELEALRDVADRTNTLAIRLVRVADEDAAAA
jgi:hypothetical protein